MKFRKDVALVNCLLGGDEAAADGFRGELYPYLRGTLRARCGDARSRTKAEEIAADVIADCFGANGSEPLLARYNGTSSLRAWLFLVGLNRLKSWWRSAHCRYEMPRRDLSGHDELPGGEAAPSIEELIGDSDVFVIMRRAFRVAFLFTDSMDLDFLRAVYCVGLSRQEVAEKWGCNVSTVSRHLEAASRRLHERVERYVEILDADLKITRTDYMAMSAVWADLLLGPDADKEGAVSPEAATRRGRGSARSRGRQGEGTAYQTRR